MEESKKQAKNLFRKLLTDADSVFYSAEKIKTHKTRKSFYEKDKVFHKLYVRIEDQNIFDDDKVKVPIYTPFLEQKKDIDHSSALYSIKEPCKLVHSDVASIHFFFQSLQLIQAIVYCVDLFSSRVCLPNEKKVFFSRKA